MPTPNGRSWLGDKWLRLADKLGPAGNNYNPETGAWSATPAQYGVRGASLVLNMLAPGLGTAVNKIYGNYSDTGSFAPAWMQRGNQGALNSSLADSQSSMQAQILARNPELAGLIGQSPTATAVGPVTRQQIGFPSNDVGQYTMAQPAMNMPTMPAVQAQAPWSGSLAQSNPFGGSYGGNLGFGSGNRPIGGNLSYGGGRAGYNNGAGAGTGFGGASFANDSWGDVASSFGVGSSSMGSRMPDMIARYSRV